MEKSKKYFDYICEFCSSPVHSVYRRKFQDKYICHSCKVKLDSDYAQKLHQKHIFKNIYEYDCARCGNHITTKFVYTLNEEKVCKKCQNIELLGTSSVLNLDSVKQASKKTMLERYGTENPMRVQVIKDKIKANNIKKYGVACTLHADGIKEKVQKTFIEKYGGLPVQNEEVKKKIKRTCLERYGDEAPIRTKEILDKIKATNLERYGVEYTLSSPEIKEKSRKTCLEKYGVENAGGSEEALLKRKATVLKKYGAEPLSIKEYRDKGNAKRKQKRNSPEKLEWRKNFAELSGYTFLGQYIRKDGETVQKFHCPKCGKTFEWCTVDDSRHAFCKSCANSPKSTQEGQIREYIQSLLHDDTISSNRHILGNSRELDIYIPDKKLAIEFDGIYWHNNKNNYYKYEICKSNNIRLIQINEFEWQNKNNLIKDYIKSTLGIFNRRLFARNCQVREISKKEYEEFINNNHLQGYIPASIMIGLFINNELVQVESFGKPRYNKKYEYELLRECSKSDTVIIGGKSKILKYFIRKYNPASIVSYCEKNKFSGKSYLDLGFSLEGESKPGYKYYKDNQVFSRVSFQKHKLEKLDNYNPDLSEKENMIANGYKIIYDYGNYIFVWNNQNILRTVD